MVRLEKGKDGDRERESGKEREVERGRNALASPPAFFSVSPQCLYWLKLVGSQKQRDLENAIYRFHLRVEGNGVAMPCTGRYEIGTEESKSSFT